MKQTIAITSNEHRKRAITIIESLPLDLPHEIVIRERKKDRSLEQNALMWKWYTIIAGELGETKEAIHEHYKAKYLVNIYERDNQDYAEMIRSLRMVWRSGMKKEAVDLKSKVVGLTSTSTATVKQMTEYLDCIEHDSAGMGIRLPMPEDNL